MPIKDKNLVVRSATVGVFVASVPEHYHINDINSTTLRGLALKILIAATATGAPTFLTRIHGSTASVGATTDPVIASRTGMTKGAEYIVPFSTSKRSLTIFFDQDSSTTTAFSIIAAYLTEPVAQDWKRTVEFY